MNKPLDELYLSWLYGQVGSARYRHPARTYWALLRELFVKEFVWIVPNDNNRVEDGRELRYEFLDDRGIDDVDPNWLGMGCSVLEMLIALSRRLSFEVEGEPRGWFWHFIDILDLKHCTDAYCHGSYFKEEIGEKLDKLIWRNYNYDGTGGSLFPLEYSEYDLRDLELWDQMSLYLAERE